MDVVVSKLVPEPREHRFVTLKIPVSLLARAHMEPWCEVSLRADSGSLIVEPLTEELEALEIYAEEGIQRFLPVLRELVD